MGMEIRKFRQKFLLPVTASATDSIAALSSDGVLAIITPKKDGSTPSIKRKLPEDVETPEKSSKYTTKHDPRSNETEKSTIIDREMVECFLPILQRGNFFTDSIFQETRQDFNTAISEVLDKWGGRSVHDPQRGTQREEPAEDNQILVDIADLTHDGEVKINVMDEELVVEGRTKKAEGGATSVKTFIRRFTLAPNIDPSAVTSVVTPDGILEITTPKKAVIPKLKEFSIQVIIELIVEESRTSPRKDSKTRRKLKDKSPAKDNNSSHSRKKKKIPGDGETEDYNNRAKSTLKEDLYKLHDDKLTGASLESNKGSLGDKSSATEETRDDDSNSDESDESQQKTESAESETRVHITDIKRYILEATRAFGSDDEAQQSKVLDNTDKSNPLESKGESIHFTANIDESIVQPQTGMDLESAVSFDEEEEEDWLLVTPKKSSDLKDDVFDISQSFDSVVDAPSLPDREEEVFANVAGSGLLADHQPIPVILNGNAQKDKYEVGSDFTKLLASFPEHFEQQSQDSIVEKENVIPMISENDSNNRQTDIRNVENRMAKEQKDISGEPQTKKKDYIHESIVNKNISDTKKVQLPEAYVTLATNDDYAIGAMVLGHSLHSVGTTRKLVVIITEDVSLDVRPMLQNVFNEVIIVNVMDSGDSAHLALLKRPELGVTFTKIHCWNLLQYSKCVFLDADMFVIQNPDNLFGYPELSAAPDIGWPDCFNSGMFVFVPNIWTYNRLLQHAQTTGSFDGGDQGLLNTFFPKWNFISFTFNMVVSAVYTYLPAYIRYGNMAKIVHFLGSFKPWHHTFNKNTGEVETTHGYHHLRGFLKSWWQIYTSLVEPGILTITTARELKMRMSYERSFGDNQGLARWESGAPDYLGQDSYMNIQAYIDNKVSKYELSNKKESSKKKTKKDKYSQKIEPSESFNLKAMETEDVSQIIEVPEINKATEKKENSIQPANLEDKKTEKEDEDSEELPTEEAEPLADKGALPKNYSKSKKSNKSQKSSKKYGPFATSTVSEAVKSPWRTDSNQSAPLYSEILSRKIKDSKESPVTSDDTTPDISFVDKIQLDISIPKEKIYKSKTVTEDLELSTISKIDVVKPSAIPEQSTIPSSKHSKKKQHIKATPTESKYSSALKGKELEEDKFETKTPKKN